MAKKQKQQQLSKQGNSTMKSLQEQKKELMARCYGSKPSKELKNLMKKIEIQERTVRKEAEERKKRENDIAMRTVVNKPKIAVKEEETKIEVKESSMVCRFLIEALHSKTYNKEWKCPISCNDIHSIDENYNLEEFLKMKRASVATDKPITKEEYDEIVGRLEKEKKRFEATLKTGYDMFKSDPSLFGAEDENEELEFD